MTMHVKARRVGGMPLPPTRFRFEALDSWRGIAATVVVLFHAQIASHLYNAKLVVAGDAFVDFFFVLSGFVIAHAYRAELTGGQGLLRFLFGRIGRLYPLHLFMLALFFGFELLRAAVPRLGGEAAFGEGSTLSSLAANLFMLQAFLPFDHLSWNAPSWSISGELLAYALFGLLAVFAPRRLAAALAGVGLLSFLALALFSARGMETSAGLGWPRALGGFALGALLYRFAGPSIVRLKQFVPASRRWRWTIAEAFAALAACGGAVAAHGTPFSYAVPLLFAAAVGIFAVEGGTLSEWLKARPMLFLGTISYSIYMTHLFILARFSNATRLIEHAVGATLLRPMGDGARGGVGIDCGSLLVGDAVVVLLLGSVFAASWFTWRCVELPGQALFRFWSERLFGRKGRFVAVRQQKGRLGEAALQG